VDVQSNWWEHFFEGAPVDLWLQALSPEHTAREADSLVRALDVSPRAELLDVPCGGGRLSLELASRGHHLTGVDWSHEFLAHARSSDAARDVTWERRDMRDLPWPARFDGAFCLGNSFGYLDDEGNEAFLLAVAAALKPGARFVLETPMVLENMLGRIQERPWWKVGDMRLLVVNR
jgi:cyclopropane fatty-acyl-phospholipid synthase-like methyltransferase